MLGALRRVRFWVNLAAIPLLLVFTASRTYAVFTPEHHGFLGGSDQVYFILGLVLLVPSVAVIPLLRHPGVDRRAD
ncbi:hypothetical protein LK09_15595 [Microbacterium mangrovi]|uniref:Uncharacterized protein n=1 Tax=Microbacterium mangrovi TaxID=1348253 RepID=A0A0B2A482_9MICO|nr:hypothetical protein [Microbacterium mangrovi]KHK96393.1 hypothetical protein LK09_15595 [Microbacterium mangrovi]